MIRWISHNADVLAVGSPALPWPDLARLVEESGLLVWEMHGQARVVPAALLEDIYRVADARQALVRLGRGEMLPADLAISIHREQTVNMPFGIIRGCAKTTTPTRR